MNIDQINYNKLPEHMRGGMRRYIEKGIIPGNFLQAVISNDLKESLLLADDTNIGRIRDFVDFLYNEAPGPSWGSRENMVAWHEKFNGPSKPPEDNHG